MASNLDAFQPGWDDERAIPRPSQFPKPNSDDRWMDLLKVFVLLFNPRSDSEGIYTLQVRVRDGSLINTVVLFEDKEDAERYSGLLEAQNFPTAHVEALDPEEILDFTESNSYKTSFIPEGTLFLPPEKSVDESKRMWQANGKHRTKDDLGAHLPSGLRKHFRPGSG